METVQLTLMLLLITAVGGVLVRWTTLGLPIFLVVMGVVASLLPGLDRIDVDPELFLMLFIPPLLFLDARELPRRDFIQVLRPVLLLALGLVVLTVVAVGHFIHWLVPAMPLAVAYTLGAIVTPTDAVATAATTAGLPLPKRVSCIVNAESLLNDASGLVAFKLAVAAAVAAGAVTGAEVLGSFVVLSGGGVLVGLIVERLGRWLRERLIAMGVDDPVLQTLLTVLIPYAAYLAAEAVHVSGVLAVVIAGLWMGGREVQGLSAEGRRHAHEVWRMISFLFNGMVFLLLGLQLRHMVAAVGQHDPLWLAFLALALWTLLMVLRLGWVWASAHVRFRLHWGWAGAESGPDLRRMLLVAWSAVRGSVTLATALSVPLLAAGGVPFPQRDMVVFLAASTIVLTLLLNGVPLPWLIRRLQPPGDEGGEREEDDARVEIARAAIAALTPELPALEDPNTRSFAQQLIHRYEGKIALRDADPDTVSFKAERIAAARKLRLLAIHAERECLNSMHASNRINDQTMLEIEVEIDQREVVSLLDARRG